MRFLIIRLIQIRARMNNIDYSQTKDNFKIHFKKWEKNMLSSSPWKISAWTSWKKKTWHGKSYDKMTFWDSKGLLLWIKDISRTTTNWPWETLEVRVVHVSHDASRMSNTAWESRKHILLQTSRELYSGLFTETQNVKNNAAWWMRSSTYFHSQQYPVFWHQGTKAEGAWRNQSELSLQMCLRTPACHV